MKKVTIPFRIIQAASAIAPRNDMRPYLNGIHLSGTHKKVVATDGHRLYMADADLSNLLESDQNITLPHPLLKGLKRASTISIQKENDTEYRLTIYNIKNDPISVQLVTPLGTENYPDFMNVIPKTPDSPLESSTFSATYLSKLKRTFPRHPRPEIQFFGRARAAIITSPACKNELLIIMPLRMDD